MPVSGSAAPADLSEATILTCLKADPSQDALVATLETLGWIKTSAKELNDDHIRSLATGALEHHLGYGKAPAARWKSIWEIALSSSQGKRKLQVVPDSPTLTTWMTVPGSPSILELQLVRLGHHPSLSCKLHASRDISEETFSKAQPALTAQNARAINPTRVKSYGSGRINRRYYVTYFSPQRISELTGAPIDIIATAYVLNSLAE
ncbi:hypothetical protein K3725_04325 [Leisingera sp. S132]|uniref:hypothetical protein n=1 Tax=Leisingera sp. S132 TaxID=2867016 RepID=UPI0021A5C603|nr:hypothetical protein [Leisingera sp. S132]UWQ80245.1 hypothetical protein K3725_04325 [Leisingera sp. S132]